MPSNKTTIYANDSEEKYITGFMVNEELDDALSKFMSVDFTRYGFKKIESYPSDPIDLIDLKESGNYTIENYINGPKELEDKFVTPLNLTVIRDSLEDQSQVSITYMIYHMLDVYTRIIIYNGLPAESEIIHDSNWNLVSSSTDLEYYIGPIEPTPSEEKISIWIDTTYEKYPVFYLYNMVDGWVPIGSLFDTMTKNIYDIDKKEEDIFKYFDSKWGIPYTLENEEDDQISFFNLRKKIQNHFDEKIHITPEEFEKLNSLISVFDMNQMIEDAKNQIHNYLIEKIQMMDLDSIHLTYNKIYDDAMKHHWAPVHVNLDLREYWNKKSDPDHIHDLDNNVTISADDVIEGYLDLSLIPDEAIDILIRVQTHEERFALTSKQVQNGDSIYVNEETEEYRSGLYLVIDDTKLGSPNSYIFYRTRKMANMDFEDINHIPNTLGGYGIEGGMLVHKDDKKQPIYPYNLHDVSFNYYLTQKINQFFNDMTEILDEIERVLDDESITGLRTLIRNNRKEADEIESKWSLYRYIGENTVPEQQTQDEDWYDENVKMLDSAYMKILGRLEV